MCGKREKGEHKPRKEEGREGGRYEGEIERGNCRRVVRGRIELRDRVVHKFADCENVFRLLSPPNERLIDVNICSDSAGAKFGESQLSRAKAR